MALLCDTSVGERHAVESVVADGRKFYRLARDPDGEPEPDHNDDWGDWAD